jgi:hypothetical protein
MQLVPQVHDLQNKTLYELGLDSTKAYDYKTEVPEIVFVLSGINETTAELALGKIGRKLIGFVNAADIEHPDLPYAIEGIFLDAFCRQQTQELLELAEKCKHLSSISANFPKLINRHRFSKRFLQADNYAPRLLKAKRDINAIRKNRKMQNVDLKKLYKGNLWNHCPDDFSIYNRHNIPYLKEIEESESRLDRLLELGCDSTANKIITEVSELRINLSHRYCGFNRIKIVTASAILARLHGFKLKTSWDIHDNQTVKVVIPNNLLYDFQPDEAELPASFIKHSLNEDHEYEARLYPLHYFHSTASEEMIKVLDLLDNFPDMNSRALFDSLLLLVPSVKLYDHNGTYFVKDKKGNILGFNAEQDAALCLDKILLSNGSIPVLLGERDGMCYFLCYWK